MNFLPSMTLAPRSRTSWALMAALCLGASAWALRAAQPVTSTAATKTAAAPASNSPASGTNEVSSAVSVFVSDPSDPAFGKDVFYPDTRRFEKKVATPDPGLDKGDTQIASQLVLKGISGSGKRRLAVINNRTLGQGEIWDFKYKGQSHRVTCEEIKLHSVVISVEGVTEKIELQLRGGL